MCIDSISQLYQRNISNIHFNTH